MQRDKRKARQALRKKGFEEEQSHHRRLHYRRINGELTDVKTYMSHGSKPKALNDYLISRMSEQIFLDKKQFTDFVDCTISQEEYEEIIKDILDKKK